MKNVQHFVDRGIIEVNKAEATVRIVNQERSKTLIDFFSKLVLPLIDTYLITLMTIEQLCGKNLIIKQKTLVNSLHVGLKYMYSQRCIPMLHSCLKATIKSAIERYSQMGLLEMTSYLTKDGSKSVFLRCPVEGGKRLRELLSRLSAHRPFGESEQNVIFTEIDEVIMRTQGPLVQHLPKL